MTKKSHTYSLINADVLHQVFGKDHAAMQAYLKEFIVTTSKVLVKTHFAIQEKNTKLALDYFHQLKGPIGTIGFTKMFKLCEQIEEKIQQADWHSAEQEFNRFADLLKELQEELEAVK